MFAACGSVGASAPDAGLPELELNERFSIGNAVRREDGSEVLGKELRQKQFKQQRDELVKIVQHKGPMKASSEKSFGGSDQAPIEYAASSVAEQMLHEADYAGFAGASKQQLDDLRKGTFGLAPIHPDTLPALQLGQRPYVYQTVNYNITHLRIAPQNLKFDETGNEILDAGAAAKHAKGRGSHTSFDGVQKIICCLTAGQMIKHGKHPTTGEQLAGHDALKSAVEAVKYYDRHGRGRQAFDYGNSAFKDELCAFYEAATKVGSSEKSEKHLSATVTKLWKRGALVYSAQHATNSDEAKAAKAAKKRFVQNVANGCNTKRACLQRTFEKLRMDSVDNIAGCEKDGMLAWHSAFCNTQNGVALSGSSISRTNWAADIFSDLEKMLGDEVVVLE